MSSLGIISVFFSSTAPLLRGGGGGLEKLVRRERKKCIRSKYTYYTADRESTRTPMPAVICKRLTNILPNLSSCCASSSPRGHKGSIARYGQICLRRGIQSDIISSSALKVGRFLAYFTEGVMSVMKKVVAMVKTVILLAPSLVESFPPPIPSISSRGERYFPEC